MSEVAVIGAGSWGSALAIVLANNGVSVKLWARRPGQVREMAQTRHNARYLPGIRLPPSIKPCEGLGASLAGAELVLMVVPSAAFRSQVEAVAQVLRGGRNASVSGVVFATKGFDPAHGGLLEDVALEAFGSRVPLGVLSGPSFAMEVARGLPTAVALASRDEQFARQAVDYFHCSSFRVYTTTDTIGVQVGGGVKNVLAIAAGIVDGLGFGANAQAALITRGLAELTRLGVAMGAEAETFAGLAGVGDLVLTCTDNQSRNRRFGLALAAGKGMEEAAREIGQVVEGARACRAVQALATKHRVEMPICAHVHQVLFEGLAPDKAAQSLLARQPRAEQD